MDKLGFFYANQTSMCLDPHKNQGLGWYRETSLNPAVIFLLSVPRQCSYCGSYLIFMFGFGVWFFGVVMLSRISLPFSLEFKILKYVSNNLYVCLFICKNHSLKI